MAFRQRVSRACLDVLCPPCCDLCGADVGGTGGFCAECFAKIRPIIKPFCERCGVPLAAQSFANKSGMCVACTSVAPPWNRTRAAFVYDDWSRQLILPLKYADRTENARILAREMWRSGQEIIQDAAFLLPVPMYKRKLRQRRYNQAALLSRFLSKKSGVPSVPMALKRIRNTQPLARLGSRERALEIEGSIVVSPRYVERLRGHPVVVIDDVLTTGATVSACTQALLLAGVSRVDLLVAARAGNMEEDRQNVT
ncbi:ComF family protein [Neokomagataea anthophila]|uniref:ComF family protein n=1 Tax=Neokomagataea anthophila TaxID=2826925 RepID=A0ABS5E6P8_9PROT|nr:ComF family protein [Neokomagataea anthophila]MBR0559571.1 ComF family protein [Neokomagataea anthophila]